MKTFVLLGVNIHELGEPRVTSLLIAELRLMAQAIGEEPWRRGEAR